MSVGLKTQIRDYASQIDEDQAPIGAAEVLALVDSVRELPRPPAPLRVAEPPVMRHRDRRWVYAAVAGLVTLLLVGGVAWLTRVIPEEEVVDPSTTTTTTTTVTPSTTVPPTTFVPPVAPSSAGLIGPGSWSIAAVDTTGTADVNGVASEVLSWDGVFDIAVATDPDSWHDLTGLDDCTTGQALPACGDGIVVLAAREWTDHVALRLESEFGMTAATALEIVDVFWDAYVAAAIAADPVELRFDPTRLGSEIPLARVVDTEALEALLEPPLSEVGDLTLYVAIEVSRDGNPVFAAVTGSANFTGDGLYTLWVGDDRVASPVSELAASNLIPDRDGRMGVALDANDAPGRTLLIGGLPVDAAVVATRLNDETPVWQRPVAGLILISKAVSSEEFPKPIGVFDADGREIMRISHGAGEDAVVTDLRVNVVSASGAGSADALPSLEVANVISLGERVPGKLWGDERIARAGDAIWVGTLEYDRDGPRGSLFHIDAVTLEATAEIPVPGGVADLTVGSQLLWALSGDGTVIAVDPESETVTDSISLAEFVCEPFCGMSRMNVLVVGDDVWIVTGDGRVRVHRDPRDGGIVVDRESADPLGGDVLLGESGGVLWTMDGHDAEIDGLNLTDSQYVEYEVHTLSGLDASDSTATLVDDAIWVVPSPDRRIARFDTTSREVDLISTGGGWYHAAAYGGLWLAGNDYVERIDLSSRSLTDSIPNVFRLGDVKSVAADPAGGIWVSYEDGTIRVDAASRQVTHVINGVGGGQLLAFDGAIWVADDDGTVSRIELP